MIPHPYNTAFSRSIDRRSLEWWCFLTGRTITQGGLGKAEHFRRAFALTWPTVEWERRLPNPDGGPQPLIVRNHWMDRIIDAAFSDEFAVRSPGSTPESPGSIFRSIVLSGVGAAGKTFCAACIAMGWWCVDPTNSIVALTSTTIEMLGKRIWPTISMLHSSMVDAPTGRRLKCGHLIESQRLIASTATTDVEARNERNAIFALPVAHGETQKAAHKLRGLHAQRMLLIIDEANGTPDAIYETIPNWRRGCADMTVIIIGNPISRLDAHGRALEPVSGWDSLASNTYQWRTKRIPAWDLESGVALRFDGADSPNVRANRTIFPYLYTWENWQSAKGRNENTLAWWSQDRGNHPPEGLLDAVINELALVNAHVDDQLLFRGGSTTLCAFLDPALGGDDAVVFIGKTGIMTDGRPGLQILSRHELVVRLNRPNAQQLLPEPTLQVARQFIDLCKQHKVAAINAGIDATGSCAGVYAFVVTLWSPEVMRFEASNSPGSSSVVDGDPRPASDVYQNRITGSWILSASLIRSGQLKGISPKAKVQFTTRKLETRKLWRGRQRLQDKAEYKSHYGASPDDADAIAGLADLCTRRLSLELRSLSQLNRPTEPDAWSKLESDWNRVWLSPQSRRQLDQQSESAKLPPELDPWSYV